MIDTLATDNDAVQVVLMRQQHLEIRPQPRDRQGQHHFREVLGHGDTLSYKEVDMSAMPASVVIELVDSLCSYHCPYVGKAHAHGKYGPRRRRQHQGIDLPCRVGDPIYATFSGRVRISGVQQGEDTAIWSSFATTTAWRLTTATCRNARSSPGSGSRRAR